MNRLSSVIGLLLLLANFACAQTPDSIAHDQLAALIKDVRTQQTQLAANQAKIDEKLAIVAEAVRQARIYASRGGR
jgi:hypothetical protein